jgi:hypothetical protein
VIEHSTVVSRIFGRCITIEITLYYDQLPDITIGYRLLGPSRSDINRAIFHFEDIQFILGDIAINHAAVLVTVGHGDTCNGHKVTFYPVIPGQDNVTLGLIKPTGHFGFRFICAIGNIGAVSFHGIGMGRKGVAEGGTEGCDRDQGGRNERLDFHDGYMIR